MSGVSTSIVAHRVSERFGVGRRQGQKYVERVMQRWSETEVEERGERKVLMRRKILAVFQKSYMTGQLSVAVRALDLLAKVDGLFVTAAHGGRTDETATESQVRKIREMGPHERRARIHELIIRAIRAEPEFAQTAQNALASLPSN